MTSKKRDEFLQKRLIETNGRCTYCTIQIDFDEAELDHFFPSSRGGTDRYENLRASCKSCNASKGNKTPLEWAEFLRDRFDKVYQEFWRVKKAAIYMTDIGNRWALDGEAK